MSFPNDATGDTLRRLAEHGVDMAAPHAVEFVVAFADEDAAIRAARTIDALGGYEITVERDEDSGEVELIAVRHMHLSYEEISAAEAELERIAGATGGTADGWGVLVD